MATASVRWIVFALLWFSQCLIGSADHVRIGKAYNQRTLLVKRQYTNTTAFVAPETSSTLPLTPSTIPPLPASVTIPSVPASVATSIATEPAAPNTPSTMSSDLSTKQEQTQETVKSDTPSDVAPAATTTLPSALGQVEEHSTTGSSPVNTSGTPTPILQAAESTNKSPESSELNTQQTNGPPTTTSFTSENQTGTYEPTTTVPLTSNTNPSTSTPSTTSSTNESQTGTHESTTTMPVTSNTSILSNTTPSAAPFTNIGPQESADPTSQNAAFESGTKTSNTQSNDFLPTTTGSSTISPSNTSSFTAGVDSNTMVPQPVNEIVSETTAKDNSSSTLPAITSYADTNNNMISSSPTTTPTIIDTVSNTNLPAQGQSPFSSTDSGSSSSLQSSMETNSAPTTSSPPSIETTAPNMTDAFATPLLSSSSPLPEASRDSGSTFSDNPVSSQSESQTEKQVDPTRQTDPTYSSPLPTQSQLLPQPTNTDSINNSVPNPLQASTTAGRISTYLGNTQSPDSSTPDYTRTILPPTPTFSNSSPETTTNNASGTSQTILPGLTPTLSSFSGQDAASTTNTAGANSSEPSSTSASSSPTHDTSTVTSSKNATIMIPPRPSTTNSQVSSSIKSISTDLEAGSKDASTQATMTPVTSSTLVSAPITANTSIDSILPSSTLPAAASPNAQATQRMSLPTVMLTASTTAGSTTTKAPDSQDDPSVSSYDSTSPTSTSKSAVNKAAPTINVTPNLPAAIAPSTGIVAPNSSQTLVQIGFDQGLNYPFVVENALATAQILTYLPIALAYALNIPQSQIIANSLRPYTKSGYTATVAYMNIPSTMLNTLQTALRTSSSTLYTQVNPSIQSLVDLIDTSIPLLPDGSSATVSGKGNSQSTGTSGGGRTSSGNADSPNSKQSSNYQISATGSLADTGSTFLQSKSSSVKVVSIGVGAAVGAGAYASVMFMVARRYSKKKARQSHVRVSSVAAMRYSGMGVAEAARKGAISNPIASENSKSTKASSNIYANHMLALGI